MKKYITASSNSNYKTSLGSVLDALRSKGIDTTKHRYELRADEYYGDTYTYKFTAPGDWIAYISMRVHKRMNPDEILQVMEDYDWYYEQENYLVNKYTSVKAMKEFASANWYGDGDDDIVYLKNLDTGKYLYGSDHDYIEEVDYEW